MVTPSPNELALAITGFSGNLPFWDPVFQLVNLVFHPCDVILITDAKHTYIVLCISLCLLHAGVKTHESRIPDLPKLKVCFQNLSSNICSRKACVLDPFFKKSAQRVDVASWYDDRWKCDDRMAHNQGKTGVKGIKVLGVPWGVPHGLVVSILEIHTTK